MDENKWNRSTEGLKNTCSLWTPKTPFAPTHSMKLLPNSTFGTVIWKTRNAYEWQEWLDLWSLRELYHTLSLLRARWIQVCQGFTQKLCDFCPRKGSVAIQTPAYVTLTICLWNRTRSRHLEPGRRETAWESTKPSTYRRMWSFICRSQIMRMIPTQIQLHSRKKDDAGPPWVRLHFRNMKMPLTLAYDMFLHSDSRVLRESFEQLPWSSMMLTIFVWSSAQRPHLEPGRKKTARCHRWENTKPCMYVIFVYVRMRMTSTQKFRRFPGKRWCWSMASTSFQNMRKAATTLPDSDTGFVDRIPGSIWPDSIRLQDVLLILTRLRCFHVSHHMKMCKREPANATFIESLQTAKTHELSQLSNGTKRADRGASAFTQECLTLAISSCFHQPTSASMCGYPDICCDIGHLRVKPFTEWPFRTGCAATVWENVKPSKYVRHFLLAKQWWESLRLKFNCTPGKRTMLVHHEWDITSKHEKGSGKTIGLRYLTCWKSSPQHLAKHCHIAKCSSHPHVSTPPVPLEAHDRSKVRHIKAAFIEFLQTAKRHLNCSSWKSVWVTAWTSSLNVTTHQLSNLIILFQLAQKAFRALLEHGQIHTKLGRTAARTFDASSPSIGAGRPDASCRYSMIVDGHCKTMVQQNHGVSEGIHGLPWPLENSERLAKLRASPVSQLAGASFLGLAIVFLREYA